MDYMVYFEKLPQLTKECGIEPPDLIFDLDEQSLLLTHCLQENGYQIVSLQTGIMPMGRGWLPGLEIDATEFVAVHPKWAINAETIHTTIVPGGQ
jgi:hypothetical protein